MAKCDKLASQYYRAQTPFCELAGLDSIDCGGPLAWCHIFSRGIIHIRYEPYNHLICCHKHHGWYTAMPLAWIEVLEKHFPERLQMAQANRYKYGKVDYAELMERFAKPDK